MANKEHLSLIKQGVQTWNAWRNDNPGLLIDLRHADLQEADLKRADLNHTDLDAAILTGADLTGANLWYCELTNSNFQHANLTGANLNCSTGGEPRFDRADLTGADLSNSHLQASLMRGANLTNARLWFTDLDYSDLTNASLFGADLARTVLSRALLGGADFNLARLGGTVLGNTDLTNAKNLESCEHFEPSILDFSTLAKSGRLPLSFLRGCGLPEVFIEYLPSLLNEPIQFYSCFISYSTKNHEFAERVHGDLQNKGVRCWFAPEDLRIGDKFRQRIDESIRLHDKLLLVLSEESISSVWVEEEVESALERERAENRIVLFPIRIDDAVMDTQMAWAASLRRQRHIGDFTRWKDHDSYKQSFDRLMRDLKSSKRTD
jgi:uncharacterized protein YjbI with pentapeptide repeats